jgi:hypothetical protein
MYLVTCSNFTSQGFEISNPPESDTLWQVSCIIDSLCARQLEYSRFNAWATLAFTDERAIAPGGILGTSGQLQNRGCDASMKGTEIIILSQDGSRSWQTDQ